MDRDKTTAVPPPPTRPANSRRAGAWAAAFAALAVALAGSAAAVKSVTVDEYQILPHGLAIWQTGDFHLATYIPPLANLLPGAALLGTSARLNTAHYEECPSIWFLGIRFMEQNPRNYHRYLLYGRSVSLLALALTCLLAFGLARSLYGPAGGLLAVAVTACCPTLLGHGALVTPDIYLAAAMIGALWSFDRLLRRPGWWGALALGAALGLGGLAKYTAGILFVLFPVLLAGFFAAERLGLSRASGPPTRWRRVAWSTGLALAIGLVLINLGYACSGSLRPLGSYSFSTDVCQRWQGRLPGWLPLPLPAPFVNGLDQQLADQGYPAYLLGEFRDGGFWNYYLVALLVKTPEAVLVLCVLAWACGRPTRREVPLLAVAGVVLGFFSLAGHKNIGIRYVLFLEPTMAVWVGRLAASRWWRDPRTHRRLVGVTAGCWVVLLAGTLLAWPNYLAYFNAASGGPANGHKVLLDSNLDWGQDLVALRDYLRANRIGRCDLAYAGRVDPAVYGIRYRNLWEVTPDRFVAVSANLLFGRMYFINGTPYWPDDPDTFRAFRDRKPVAVLGYTIYVYDLGTDP